MEKYDKDKIVKMIKGMDEIIDFLQKTKRYQNRVKEDGMRDTIIDVVLTAEYVKRCLENLALK